MRVKGRFLLACLLLLFVTLGCSRQPVDGTIYVIKGAGNVVRAAAVDVHVLDYESVQAFEAARVALTSRADTNDLERYLAETCRTFESSRAETLKGLTAEQGSFSAGCEAERIRVRAADGGRPEEIQEEIRQREEQLADLRQSEAAALERDAASKVTVTYDYSAGDFGKVNIVNGGKYWVTSGIEPYPASVSGFVQGVRIVSCQVGNLEIAPGASFTVDLGACVSDSEKLDTLLRKGLARRCRQASYVDVPCFDEFGPEQFDLETPGNYRRGEWTLAHREERKSLLEADYAFTEVDFASVAEQTESVLQEVARIEALRTALNEAQREHAALARCEVLVAHVDLLGNGSCPSAEDGRAVVSQFRRDLANMGIAVADLPSTQANTVERFAISMASSSTRTNVEGRFTLASPPRGAFLIYASYSDNFSGLSWLIPVSGDTTEIELNNTNALSNRDAP